MIEELQGTVTETLRLLASQTLDPRDETIFCERRWTKEAGESWEMQGGFLDSEHRFHLRHVGDFAGIRALADALSANQQTAAFQSARQGLLPYLERWLAIGRRNPWIREAYDPPFTERSFTLCRTPEQVANMVDRNNWTLGQAFVLVEANICMIQQCDGPGEFLMVRENVKFDSWTTGHPYIHGAKLVSYLNAVASAPLNSRGEPEWYDLVQEDEAGASASVVLAETA